MNTATSKKIRIQESCKKSLALLNKVEKKKLYLITFFQFFSSILDLLAVFMIGVATLSLSTTDKSTQSSGVLGEILKYFHGIINSNSGSVLMFCALTLLILIVKSLVSLYIMRRLLLFLSRTSAKVSDKVYDNFINQDIAFIHSHSSQGVVSALNVGVSNAILGMLSSFSLLISEFGFLLILAIGLSLIDPIGTILVILYFAIIILILNRTLSKLNTNAGRNRVALEIKATTIIQESILSFREMIVMNKGKSVSDNLSAVRRESVRAFADAQWVSFAPKYLMETALVISAGLLSFYQFAISDSRDLLSNLAVFLAAGSRILPSALRIQGALSSITNYSAASQFTFDFIDSLPTSRKISETLHVSNSRAIGDDEMTFIPCLSFDSVSYKYPGQKEFALKNITLDIKSGTSTAIVGTSGAGKTTLVDLMVGLITPETGTILISGHEPSETLKNWPNKVGYVPQQVFISNGTVRENVAFTTRSSDIDDEKVWEALRKSELANFFHANRDGIYTSVGEHGVKLSGGQRQRLGMARALYTDPQILILDEATSALDSETEFAISKTLKLLEGGITLIVIAHRLTTIQNIKNIIYLESGEILAMGSFQHLKDSVPRFELQASLMGFK